MPLLHFSVTFSLHPSPAQPKVLVPKLLLISHCSDHTRPVNSFMSIPLFRFSVLCLTQYPCVSNFTPLSHLVLMAQVQPQKPSLLCLFCHFILFARLCSCHISCSHSSHSLPQYVATLPPVLSLSMVKEAFYTALAPGSLKQVTSQKLGPS